MLCSEWHCHRDDFSSALRLWRLQNAFTDKGPGTTVSKASLAQRSLTGLKFPVRQRKDHHHYKGPALQRATIKGNYCSTFLCRGGQPVDNSTRRVLLDLVHRRSRRSRSRSRRRSRSRNPGVQPSSLGEIKKTHGRDQNGIRILKPWNWALQPGRNQKNAWERSKWNTYSKTLDLISPSGLWHYNVISIDRPAGLRVACPACA